MQAIQETNSFILLHYWHLMATRFQLNQHIDFIRHFFMSKYVEIRGMKFILTLYY